MKMPETCLGDLEKDRAFNSKRASKATLNTLLLQVHIFSRALSSLYCNLTKKHIIMRRRFANMYKNWTKKDWDLVIFSDKSDLFPTKCERRYYRFIALELGL